MTMSMHLCMHIECGICDQPIQFEGNLKDYLTNGFNDPITIILFLIKAGCCPACGTVCSSTGQTPDDVLERFNNHLLEQLMEKLEEEDHDAQRDAGDHQHG